MSLLNTLSFIVSHPLSRSNPFLGLYRFIKWQVFSRLFPNPVIFDFAEKSKIIVSRGENGATGNIYCGLHEFFDMGFALHFLRDTDIFIDIGANVGSYTLLASGEVGAQTLAFEPIPSTYSRLNLNIIINMLQSRVQAFNIGLGSEEGLLNFTSSFDTVNHVATTNEFKDSIQVPVRKLDDIVKLSQPTLIKVDVEGFEYQVLKGMIQTLKNPLLKAIIIEINGSGKRYGVIDNDIHEFLIHENFYPYSYFPFERKVNKLDTFGNHNTIYMRDVEFIKARVLGARKISINNVSF